jgi:DNA-binding response OmpR family regulator
VVDDDDTMLAIMEVVLKSAGFRVLLAENGVQGSTMLREHTEISAVVTDAVLPGRSGLELAREARRRALPVLLVSGHDQDLLGELDMPILSKPFGAKLLAETVGKMVEEG